MKGESRWAIRSLRSNLGAATVCGDLERVRGRRAETWNETGTARAVVPPHAAHLTRPDLRTPSPGLDQTFLISPIKDVSDALASPNSMLVRLS